MDTHTPFPNKRLFDHSTVDHPSSAAKRRHHHHHHLPSSPATPHNNPFRNPIKLSPGETLFRILCPSSKTGGLIGKGGAVIRQVREETGAKIRIDESIPGSEERVIYIVASDCSNNSNSNSKNDSSNDSNSKNDSSDKTDGDDVEFRSGEGSESLAQKTLVRIFERILKVDEERNKVLLKVESENEVGEGGGAGEGIPQGPVVCRLLAGSNQIGCVLGRGGKIIEKIRQESGAQVRVLPKDQLPDCASPGDELIQMAGKFLAVKKAILAVSSCLQEAGNSVNNRPVGMPHGYGNEPHHRMGMEEEVVFRLLCPVDKVGSLIGKGGSTRRALQAETGASIKIADPSSELDERVVVISALESLEQRHSPAQDAVMRVHGRIAEMGFEPGVAIVARLLVHSRQIGCLWGKGGMIISEMRRVTGANIQIFPKEQVAKYAMPSDEVVQVIGSLPCVQDALFQITGRLRETVFPMKPYFPNAYMGPYPEMPPPSFRPRHDPDHPPLGPFEPPPPFLHGVDHVRPDYSYSYGNERPGYGPPVNRHFQSGSNRYAGEMAEFEGGFAKVNDSAGRNEMSGMQIINVEIVIPENYLGCVYGENKSNIGHIKEISGAQLAIHEEGGRVVLTGTSDETHTAQCLLHAFILCEQHLTRAGL